MRASYSYLRWRISERPALLAGGLTLALIVALSLQATSASGSTTAPSEPGESPFPGYELAWSDEFNGSRVDRDSWYYRTDVRGDSVQTSRNVSVSDGLLRIKLDHNPKGGPDQPPYTGGGVISREELKYGYYEVRARLNKGSGWHPAFWRLGYIGEETCSERLCYEPGFPRYPSTEIDGFEWESNTGNITYNLHEWDWSGAGLHHVTSGPRQLGFDASEDWHTYGFEFTEDGVRYFVDGTQTYETSYPATDHFHDYASIWLTAVAFPATAGPVDETMLPGEVSFDYFRYYKQAYYVSDVTPGLGLNTDGQVSKTGTWYSSSLVGFERPRSEYSSTPGSTYTWSVDLPVTGQYEVFAYNVQYPSSDPAARYVVDGLDDQAVVVNQASTPAGWVSLGTFDLAGGESHNVTLTRGAGYTRADAVKFVRVQ